ncbi:hypothetical protein SJAG_04617 [Schizosaccharomyces japonicus yFS275]|uniref:Uncharacterized protein n=1 Tax=Schizosaccharomyces japonicus (strain yFS275 / FY16936) TaxID=402676 RepID=B6K7A9_SCHJY|nr:hypothetical protein SJAG_04617 [Schizosaccharomyces japonicus yFS275]EEB09413.1 hypothetical protein SJAG_04617 [Schizosaccharomyces japonicus yFS275]
MSLVFREIVDEEFKDICETFRKSIDAEFSAKSLTCDLFDSDLFVEQGTSQIFTSTQDVILLPLNVIDALELRVLEENVSIPLAPFEPIEIKANEHCFLSWERLSLRNRIRNMQAYPKSKAETEEAKCNGIFIAFGLKERGTNQEHSATAPQDIPAEQKVILKWED